MRMDRRISIPAALLCATHDERAGLLSCFLTLRGPHAPAAFSQRVRSMTSSRKKQRAPVRIAREDATTRKMGANQNYTVTPYPLSRSLTPGKEAVIYSTTLLSYFVP